MKNSGETHDVFFCYSSTMKQLLWILCLGVFTYTWAQPKNQEIPIPLNVGLGPSFHHLPATLSNGKTFLPGVSLDVFLVISPEVLQQYKDRIPKRYRHWIQLKREMHLQPWYFTLLPTSLVLEPGKKHEVYGATWNFVELAWYQDLPFKLSLLASVKLPTITYLWVKSPQLQKGDEHLVAFGASPQAYLLWKLNSQIQLTVGYIHCLYLPLKTSQYKPLDRNSENWTTQGILEMKLHWRIPISRRL